MPKRSPVSHACVIWLLAALLSLAGAQIALEQYSPDWATVQQAAQPKDLQIDCPCSLLNSTCTPNCCCDSSCPAAAITIFEQAGTCLPGSFPQQELAYCVDNGPFAKVNLPSGNYFRLQKRVADSDFLTQLLCIARDSNPSLGYQYPDPPAGDADGNAQEVQCPAASSQASPAAPAYTYGMPVVAVYPSGSRGPLVLPSAALSAECLDVMPVGFMVPLPAGPMVSTASCQRSFSDNATLATACASATDPWSTLFYSGLSFPTTPSASVTLDATITSITYVDPETGAFSNWGPAKPAVFTSSNGTSSCSGLVTRAQWSFRYAEADKEAGTAQLAAVSVSLVVSDVTLDLSSSSSSSSGGGAVLRQGVQVAWAAGKTPDQALQPFSGLPGYLHGYPVLAGVKVTSDSKSAVNRYKQGLLLPGPGIGGQCDSRSLAPVAFGYNSSTACGNSLDLDGVKAFCTGRDPTKLLQRALRSYLTQLGSGGVLVGVWGNSDAGNPGEWVSLEVSGWPLEAPSWDESKQTCSKVATGFDVRLLTGLSWANGEVQSKILYAQLCFNYGTWAWQQGGPAVQQFPLRFTAAFVPKQQEAPVQVLKPAPPLSVPLPPDLFYPFLTSGAGRALHGLRPHAAVAACGAAVAGLLLLL